MADPRKQLTAQEFLCAVSSLRAEGWRAERHAADPHYESRRSLLKGAVEAYEAPAEKLPRIAARVSDNRPGII